MSERYRQPNRFEQLKRSTVAGVAFLALSCMPDQTPTPDPLETPVPCALPERPLDILQGNEYMEGFQALTLNVDGSEIKIRNYVPDTVTMNGEMVETLYELFGAIKIPEDLQEYAGDATTYEKDFVGNGTVIAIMDEPVSFLRKCYPNAGGFTINAPSDSFFDGADVTVLSVDQAEKQMRGRTLSGKLAHALAVEIAQQHTSEKNRTDFETSLTTGFGELIRFGVDNEGGWMEEGYPQYFRRSVLYRLLLSKTTDTVPPAIFSQEIFDLAKQSLTEPIFTVTQPMEVTD